MMDSNQQIPPVSQPPIQPLQNMQKKTNWTGIIIFLLIIVASSITAAAYFIIQEKNQGQQSNNAPSDAQTISEVKEEAPWTTYTDKNYGYFFYYPQNWKLENDKTNPEKFFLRMSSSQPGEIQGEFMPREQFSKEIIATCAPVPQRPCFVYGKAASSSAYVYPTIDNNNEITTVIAYITRPNGAGFLFKVNQQNDESYDVLLKIIETLQFSNEKRSFPLLICPDSWSEDRTTATYRGITFKASDIDENWLRERCTQQ